MATLADLIKSFRHNVREGNPCNMRFEGKTIQLYPTDINHPNYHKTKCGIVVKASTR